MSRIVVKDLGFDSVVKKLKGLRGTTVVVGLMGGAAHVYDDGTTVVSVAAFNEFGTSTIPARPFIRSTMDEQRQNIGDLVQKLAGRIADGKIDRDRAARFLGEFAKSKIQKKIVDLREPPNAQSTIDSKGSSNPLIDTGAMRQAVTYAVVKGKNGRRGES